MTGPKSGGQAAANNLVKPSVQQVKPPEKPTEKAPKKPSDEPPAEKDSEEKKVEEPPKEEEIRGIDIDIR